MDLTKYLNMYSLYIKEEYKEKINRIGLGISSICPNRKNDGCVFCLPDTFERETYNNLSIAEQIERHINGRQGLYIAYFQSETSTYGDEDELMKCFSTADDHPAIAEIVISTRPDFLEESLVSKLKQLKKRVTVEIGVQSIHDKSLKLLNRNHTFADIEDAMDMLSDYKINSGAHLIVGLPGESLGDLLDSIRYLNSVEYLTEIKFHNLVIYKNTSLAELDVEEEIPDLNEYIEILSECVKIMRPDIYITRCFTSNVMKNGIAVNPFPGTKKHWMNSLFHYLKEYRIFQGMNWEKNGINA